jgi:hypothetical protein
MRARLIVLSLAVCGACLSAVPQAPAPAESQQAAEVINFNALRAQAIVALEALQQSRERRLASVAKPAF